MSFATLQNDAQLTAPDAHVIAQSLVDSAKRINKAAPAVSDLATAITAISPESHIKGASALNITIEDPAWELLDSGFFSPSGSLSAGSRVLGGYDPTLVAKQRKRAPADKSKLVTDMGKLDPLDINYPDGSRFWWRLSKVSPKANRTVTMTFIDRIAALLQGAYGPIKASRDSMTRAEFLRMTTQRIKQYGGIEFHSAQLHVKQTIDPLAASSTASSNTSASGAKTAGLGANAKNLTVLGKKINGTQIAVANTLLAVAEKYRANDAATVAIIYAGMGETSLGDNGNTYGNNGVGFTGVLQGSVKVWNPHDTVGMATAFMQGGKGFQAGGALALSKTTNNPAEIAIRVEVPSIWPNDAYASHWAGSGTDGITEARAIVHAAGGAAGGAIGSVETIQPYYFTVGTADNSHESLWDAEIRLSQEVNWELFTDGNRMYYDSEMTLIRQKPAAVIDRDDQGVIDWYYDWETRNIATQMTLQLICEPFQFRAGEVFQLERFGPASDGSTVGLPGRWLVTDIIRNPGDLSSQFTLKQPEQPKREPAPGVTSTSVDAAVAGTPGTVAAVFAAAKELSNMKLPYIWGGGHAPGALDDKHPKGLDCSGSVCWALHKGGMFPSSAADTSGTLATSWGQPGKGQTMTIWANPNHVFIEFYIIGTGWYQLNTSVPNQNGPRLVKWGPNGRNDAESGAFTPRHWSGT